MDKEPGSSRLKEIDTVQLLAEKHGKFLDKLREAKVQSFHCRCKPLKFMTVNYVAFAAVLKEPRHGLWPKFFKFVICNPC